MYLRGALLVKIQITGMSCEMRKYCGMWGVLFIWLQMCGVRRAESMTLSSMGCDLSSKT